MDLFDDIKTDSGEKKVLKKTFQPFSTILAQLEVSIIYTPFILTKEKLSEWLVKHLSTEIDSIYIVGWRDNENPFYINFPEMLDRVQSSRNSLFIIEDIITFFGYAGDISLMSYTNNFYLMIADSFFFQTSHSDIISRNWPDIVEFWPSPLDIPIDIVYNRKTSLISGGQLKEYNNAFIEWRKSQQKSYEIIDPPESLFGYLNVYLDENIPSLESVTKDIAIQRSPKFRDIIQSVMFHNKKRHFISMISGKKGMDTFESLYGKLDMGNVPIHVIRSSEPLTVRENKIEEINSNNSPLVVLSDFHFTEDMAIKNIDYYHITSGGKQIDIISILSFLKGNNYTGTYPRKLNINNYITETPTSDQPMDSIIEKTFSQRLTKVINFDKTLRAGNYRIVFLEHKLNVVIE